MLTLITQHDEPAAFSRARKLAWEKYTTTSPPAFDRGEGIGGCVAIKGEKLQGGIVALPFSRAFSTYGQLLSKRFVDEVQGEKDASALFSLAAHTDGFFIYVPPGARAVSFPLSHVLQGKNAITRVHIVLGKGAELQLDESFEMGRSSICMTHVTCEVEDEGRLTIHSFAEGLQNLTTFYRVFLKGNASLTFTSLQEASFSKSVFRCALLGKGASLSYTDFSYVTSGSSSERFSSVDHLAQETNSRKYVKKVVADGGLSRYTGKISIGKEGALSHAKQMHRALTLGENAHCYASPLFDIFQGEAQAIHGSTIAPFDEELLFYARSRGLGMEDAKKCMLQAFCDDILSLFPPVTQIACEKRWL